MGQSQETLSQDDGSLFGSDYTSSNHKEIVVNNTVVGETSKRSDVLLSNISFGGGVVLNTSDGSGSNSVDLLVDFSSVVVTELTSSSASPSD